MNDDTLSQLLSDYTTLRNQPADAMRWPRLDRGSFTSETLKFEDAAAAMVAMEAFAPVFGWASFASASYWLQGPGDWRDGHGQAASSADCGPLMACELVDGAGNNLLLQLQAGRWQGARIRHLPEGDLLVDATTLLGRRGAPQRLHYRRYHDHDSTRGLRPVLACLIAPLTKDDTP